MPGIVVFNRRWSVGSDDFIVPAVILMVLHLAWITALAVVLNLVEFDGDDSCGVMLRKHILGFLVILCVSVVIEAFGAWLSLRGTILNTEPRAGMPYVLYIRLGVFVVEIVWQVIGIVWIAQHFATCTHLPAKHAILGIIICNWVVMLCIVVSIWCTFDAAGHSWVKLKRYQESLKGREVHSHQKRCSGNSRRNWRHRKAMRKYEQSWDRRCHILFCCITDDKHQHSFAEVAKLFTEFFRDLDVVPSDIVAGLVLLRKHQQFNRNLIVSQDSNDVYQFLSGVAITPSTKFVNLQDLDVKVAYSRVVHYMRYALAAYGWPVYMMMNTGTGFCKIMPHLRCTCCCYVCCKPKGWQRKVVDDNCCQCNFAALCKLTGLNQLDVIYATYHVDIGETPFFIAVDHEERTIVISIRGTLSLQDILTDLKADAEMLPVEPVREDWLAHKGMVQAAAYIRKKIKDEMLLADAFSRDTDRGTQNYELVVVGHSLGAGTAAILAIMMKQEYPSLHCYAYSPPGGLLSMACVEETKSFITSVIVGKDFVPRIGLHQLEALRQDLINVIKKSVDPKWKIITGSMLCCCKERVEELPNVSTIEMTELMRQEKESRNFYHPSDGQIALSAHTPLYLPGKIIHIVRNHRRHSDCWSCGHEESFYEAIWAENTDFDEVLISPVMANDHLPDKVLEALEKVLRSPTVLHNVTCNSNDPAEREKGVSTGNTAATAPAASAGAAAAVKEDTSLAVFTISSENQFPSVDSTAVSDQSNQPKILDSFEPHLVTNRPLIKPMLSLSVKHDDPKMLSSLVKQSQSVVPLASPEAFSEPCSLLALDSINWKKGAGRSPKVTQMKNLRRVMSLPSTNSANLLARHSFHESSPVELGEGPGNGHPVSLCPANTDVPENCFPMGKEISSRFFHAEVSEKPSAPNGVTDLDRSNSKNAESSDVQFENLTYETHSPDRDSLGCQFLYDDLLGHYSPAGRGYPHGFTRCLDHLDLPVVFDSVKSSVSTRFAVQHPAPSSTCCHVICENSSNNLSTGFESN